MNASDLIAFETRIKEKWERGELPCLLHLCGGNEDQLIEIFADIRPCDWVFSTHRNHYHALLKGIPPEEVRAQIMAGNSMFMFSREHNFFTSAILAGTCGIAAGVAYDLKYGSRGAAEIAEKTNSDGSNSAASASPREPHVWCFLGDGAEEEGHFYEAALFAEANDLPLTLIIEDNDRQVETDKVTRRGPLFHPTDAEGWRERSSAHGPLDDFNCVRRYHYTPTYPHAGSGCGFKIEFKEAAISRLREAAGSKP